MTRAIATTNGLSLDAHLTLAQCESEILDATREMEAARDRYRFRVGTVLDYINERRLYREWCDTFEEYTNARWHLPKASAHEWINASRVARNIAQAAAESGEVMEPPDHVSHTKQLGRLPDKQQAQAWQEARALAVSNGHKEPTLHHVESAVNTRLNQPAPRSPAEDQHDREQRALCDHIRRLWPSIDADRRAGLLAELAALNDESVIE